MQRKQHVVEGRGVAAEGAALHERLPAHPVVEGGFAGGFVGGDEGGDFGLFEAADSGEEVGVVGVRGWGGEGEGGEVK